MPLMIPLASELDLSNAYVLIIEASIIIVLSHFYNLISERTRIPSVLMLIITGVLISLGLKYLGVEELVLMKSLEILGIVGLIMIVLEAALDLKLARGKLPLIARALLVALLCLLASVVCIAALIQQFIPMSFTIAMLYATPLAIMSSAIIIPSVAGLIGHKREFMVYESAFSDILGIMFFYFIISLLESGGKVASIQFGGSLVLTVIVAIIASYLLVFLFKDMKGHVKLFLLIAILLLLYSAGKLLHLSPLLIILIFGMALSNHQTVFKIFRNDLKDGKDDPIEKIEKEFHLITLETAFLVRTFFFVIFGMTIDLASLVDMEVFLISMLVLVILYVVRFIFLKLLMSRSITPELWIAPRGLITILLFFAIPEEHIQAGFSSGVLLYVIIISSVIMTFGLIYDKGEPGAISPVGAEEAT
ncbi:MAG: sodium:proton exchanger [Saprospiraceae bacterium]|nr:sodium:proton exchanger [Saprospiraceae bacterium]